MGNGRSSCSREIEVSLNSISRILILGPHLSQGGGVTNYYNTLGLHSEQAIDYFSVNNPRASNIVQKLFSGFAILFRLLTLIPSYQILHVNPSLNAKSFWRDGFFIFVGRLFRKDVLVFFRGWDDSFQRQLESNKVMSLFFRLSYGGANRFVVLGQFFEKRLRELGVSGAKPIDIETTVADDSRIELLDIEKKLHRYEEELNFLFMSRIVREKGIYQAIDCFDCCQRSNPSRKMRFHIAGDGEEMAGVRAYIKKRAVPNIQLHGYVGGRQKADLLINSHIFLFPSYHGEGMPNCVLEAMLFGQVIISRSMHSITSIVVDGVHGRLISSMKGEDFADSCAEYINDRETYRGVLCLNNKKALASYTPMKVKSRLLSIYADMSKSV